MRQGLPKYALPLFLRVVQNGTLVTTGTNKQQKNILRNQGVDPDKTGDDLVYRLGKRSYEPFGRKEWRRLHSGKMNL